MIEPRPNPLSLTANPLPSLPHIPTQPILPPRDVPGRVEVPAREYLRPTYAERFHCIASACEDTCCKGWGVPVDQAAYERFRSTESMRPHLGTLIVLNTNQPSSSDYARIPLTTEAACPFLDVQQMCGVQKQHGPEMLPVTCATYPRAISSHAGVVEHALNLSCPEAARVTLLEDHTLLWGIGRERYAAIQQEVFPAQSGYDPALAIRDFALLLVTDRSYRIWQRLYLLGILARRLKNMAGAAATGVWVRANPGQVADLLADSAGIAARKRLRSLMDVVEANPAEQLQMMAGLLRQRLSEPPVPMRLLECVAEFERGLGFATASSEQEILDSYRKGYRKYFRPWMEQHPHALENYMVNHVFKNNYPFGRETRHTATRQASDPEQEHLSLCVHAALVQTLLIGMAACHREAFDGGHVVKLIQSFAKTFEHSDRSLEQMGEFIREHHLGGPNSVAMLMKHED